MKTGIAAMLLCLLSAGAIRAQEKVVIGAEGQKILVHRGLIPVL